MENHSRKQILKHEREAERWNKNAAGAAVFLFSVKPLRVLAKRGGARPIEYELYNTFILCREEALKSFQLQRQQLLSKE